MYFKKTIQIILATHSPFIISDLPRTSVYLIIKNNQVNTVKNNMVDETFGGNIFDILKNPFFIENGIVGEFSKNKINSLISDINSMKICTDEMFKEKLMLINTIGEPYVRNHLLNILRTKHQMKIENYDRDELLMYYKKKIQELEDREIE